MRFDTLSVHAGLPHDDATSIYAVTPSSAPSRIATPPSQAATRSAFPSPFKSPIATRWAGDPVSRSILAPNVPSPLPGRIESAPVLGVRRRGSRRVRS